MAFSYLSSCTHKFDGDIVESIIESQQILRDSKGDVLSNSDDRGLLLLISDILTSIHGDIELEVPTRFEDLFTLDNDSVCVLLSLSAIITSLYFRTRASTCDTWNAPRCTHNS